MASNNEYKVQSFTRFDASDVSISSLKVNKNFFLEGSGSLISSDINVDRFIGIQGNYLISQSQTGQISGEEQYSVLVYNSIKQLYYTNKSTVLNEQYNSQVKQLQDADIELSKSMKNFSLLDAVQDDVEHSFADLIYQPAALLGHKGAMEKITTGQQTTAEMYPEMDFSKGGWEYFARTSAQQSGVLALAIATQGMGTAVGLTEGAIATATAGMFGVGAAGGKRAELEAQLQNVDATHQAILELESMKDEMDPEQFKKARLALVKARDDNNMSNTQKWGIIASTGIIEGTVTRFLGTIPNLSKTWKAVMNPLDDIPGLIARKNLQATGSALFQFGKNVGGEILEEELIHFGTAGAEAAWLGKEVDFSGWQDVALSAIMVAGPMNGPGIAYSTYAQQVATNLCVMHIIILRVI